MRVRVFYVLSEQKQKGSAWKPIQRIVNVQDLEGTRFSEDPSVLTLANISQHQPTSAKIAIKSHLTVNNYLLFKNLDPRASLQCVY